MINLEFTGINLVRHDIEYHDATLGKPDRALKYSTGEYIITEGNAYVTRENNSLVAKLYYRKKDKTYYVDISFLIRRIIKYNNGWCQKITPKLREAIEEVLFENPFYPVESIKDGCPQGIMRLHKMKFTIWKAIYLYNLKVSVTAWKKGEKHSENQTKLEFFDGRKRFTRVLDEVIKIRKKDGIDVLQLESWLGEQFFIDSFPMKNDLIVQKMN